MEFNFSAPRPATDREAQMLEACVEVANAGGTETFTLRVKEEIVVARPKEGESKPRIWRFSLDFSAEIPVKKVRESCEITCYSFEEGDAGSEKMHSVHAWADDGYQVEVDGQRPVDMTLPEYLRRTSVDWASGLVEAELAAGGKFSMDGITARIARQFEDIEISVRPNGTPTITRRQEQPVLRMEPHTINGPTHFLTLNYAEKAGEGWKERLVSFPIGDTESARVIRDELVDRYCADREDYGYDWTDACVKDRHGEEAKHESLMAGDYQALSFDRFLIDFGLGFASAFNTSSLEWVPIQNALSTGDSDKIIATIRDIAEIRPKEYSAFLKSADWELPFDPLVLYELRLRQYHGLDIREAAGTSPNSSPTI